MAIQWGPFEFGGGNGMRVGIEVDWENISHGENVATATLRIFTENQFNFQDNQQLNYGGAIGGTHDYFNGGSSGSSTQRDTKSFSYTYGSGEYGSSPGNRTFTARVTGTYNGITPSVSVNSAIPARPAAVPDTPSQQAPTQIDDHSVRINYSVGFDGGDNITHADVQHALNSGFSSGLHDHTDTSGFSSYDGITDLDPNTQYWTRVRVRNSVGHSDWSNSRNFTTDIGVPSAPTNINITNILTTSADVSWDAPSDDGGTSIDGYRVQVATDSGFNDLDYNVFVSDPSTSRNVTGLTPGTDYFVRVRAFNGTHNSPYSSVETFETVSSPSDVSANFTLAVVMTPFVVPVVVVSAQNNQLTLVVVASTQTDYRTSTDIDLSLLWDIRVVRPIFGLGIEVLPMEGAIIQAMKE